MTPATPTASPQSAAVPAARTRIVAAARRHFLAHGFRGVTMDDLAAELGMSKKTFYAHFPGKASLVEAVLQDKLSSVEADLERITRRRNAPFMESLQELLASIQEHTGEIQPAFLRDIRRDVPELFTLVEQRRAAIIERCFTRLLKGGCQEGRVRRDVPLPLLIDILLAATQAIMNPRKLAELKLTPQRAYTAVLDVILRGMMTAEGRKTS